MASPSDRVLFTLNGEQKSVPLELAQKTIASYLRFHTNLTGTKVSCAQGGCGACTVAVTMPGEKLKSVNACLVPLASIHGCALITVEGLARPDGTPHPISERLAKFNGSQCGYCSPGMVMQMFATLSVQDGGKNIKMGDMENCINGNICRCTGYRPIIECAKSFASDSTIKNQVTPGVAVGPYDAAACDPEVVFPEKTEPLFGKQWLRPESLADLLQALSDGAVPICGGTAGGIYEDLNFLHQINAGKVLADVKGVPEFRAISATGETIQVGAAVTWNAFSEHCRQAAAAPGVTNPAALEELAARCCHIAGNQVRNVGTIGGNICMTRNKGFLSDWVPPLAALGTKVFHYDKEFFGYRSREIDLLEFVQEPTEFLGLIERVVLPMPPADMTFRSYRVANRGHNAHAIVNAAFAARLAADQVISARLVLGAVDPKPVRLKQTEKALVGIRLEAVASGLPSVVTNVCDKVRLDLNAMGAAEGREECEHIVCGFMMKFLTALFGHKMPKEWHTAEYCLHDIERTSTAVQSFPPPVDLKGALNKPMTKTTAVEQTTGSAKFCDDLPRPMGTLIGALVLCPQANAVVTSISTEPGKAILGDKFHSMITADDLAHPSIDTCQIASLQVPPEYKEGYDNKHYVLLPKDTASKYCGQPVALLLAHSDEPKLVEKAAAAISQALEVQSCGPVLCGNLEGTSEEVAEPLVTTRGKPVAAVIEEAKARGGNHYISGKFTKKSQYHFYMECQTVTTIPDEGGILCYAACQSPEVIQRAICVMTGLPQNKVIAKMKRVGGGFGGKWLFTASMAAMASAASLKLNRAVRLVLPREVDMTCVGGRPEIDATWQVAVEPATGRILGLDYDVFTRHGAGEGAGKLHCQVIAACIDEVYAIPAMQCCFHFTKQHMVETNPVRAPGHYEAVLLMEAVMDGVSSYLGLPGDALREKNFARGRFNTSGLKGSAIPQGSMDDNSNLALWKRLKEKTGYNARVKAVKEFNKGNLWKKRGISMTPARYGMVLAPGNAVRVDIFKDGSVQVATTGSEIGQGLHVKVAQMVSTAFERQLGVGPSVDSFRFTATDTEQIPNGAMTGGSTTSEGAMFAAADAVDQLVPRLKPYAKLASKAPPNGVDRGPWCNMIAHGCGTKFLGILAVPLNLSAIGFHLTQPTDFLYETYGVAAAEVELDVLTGETKILKSHLIFDIGQSYNPMIDIGQMEGAFIMGVGNCLLEGTEYDSSTGALLTDNTWTYKPPLATDVPEDFTVELVDMTKERLNNPIKDCLMPVVGGLMGMLGMPWKPTKTPKIFKSAKAIGEPPVLLAAAVQSALYDAVRAARGPLPDLRLPMPAKPFVLLRMLKDQRPGSGNFPDEASTATGVSTAGSQA